MVTIYHNTRCSKSRCALELMEEQGTRFEVVHYLDNPPTVEELKKLLALLGMKPHELVRTGEPLYKEKYEGKKIAPSRWLAILSRNPILIERPIVVKGNKAIIARPPELVKAFLKK